MISIISKSILDFLLNKKKRNRFKLACVDDSAEANAKVESESYMYFKEYSR